MLGNYAVRTTTFQLLQQRCACKDLTKHTHSRNSDFERQTAPAMARARLKDDRQEVELVQERAVELCDRRDMSTNSASSSTDKALSICKVSAGCAR